MTRDDFQAAMEEMNEKAASGPDEIPAIIYCKYAKVLAEPVRKIWRICLDEGIMPNSPILSIITPIYKGGGKSEPGNYRPAALTNHLTKVFEKVVRKCIVRHITDNALSNVTQHGFTEGRSTISQLLSYYDSVLSMLEEKDCQKVDVIYLDFAKAFDKVDHGLLAHRMKEKRIGGKVSI